MTYARESFETLDFDELAAPTSRVALEAVPREARGESADESGPRRLPEDDAPRGVWSDVAPKPHVIRSGALPPPPPVPAGVLPPPLPRAKLAPSVDPDPTWEPEPPAERADGERVDLDGLVRDLSTRPPAKEARSWDLPAAPLGAVDAPAPRSIATAKRALPAWAWGVGMIATYLLGVGTPAVLGWTSSEPAQPAVAPSASEPAREEASAAAAAIGAHPSAVEPAPTASTVDEPARIEPFVIATPEPARRTHGAPAPTAREDAPATTDERETSAARDTAARDTAAYDAIEAPAHDARAHHAASSEAPAREDVQRAMSSVRPAVEACASAADQGQLARVRFTFTSDGRPAHTVVSGVAGPTASCIARAARRVRLPAFARERFTIEFPFQL